MIEWLKYLAVGDLIVLGIVYASLWFLYKNFMRKVMDTIDRKMDRDNCLTLRLGCQEVMTDKRKSGVETSDVRFEAITEKLDLIIERQMQVITRMDSHINGHGHKKYGE
jgi:hypothetical protein